MTPSQPIEGYPYAWPVKDLRPGMVTAYGVLVVTDVGKTGEHFKRGNAGTYYEEWYVELNDPTGRRGTLRWKTLTEFDTITFMLDENSEPVIWEEGMEVSTSGRSLF